MKNLIYKKSIYIAKPIGSHKRLIRKKDLTCLQVNDEYIKYGKSDDTAKRKKDYEFDNDGNIEFYSVVNCEALTLRQLQNLETNIGRNERIKKYRVSNPIHPPERKRQRITEWCKNLDTEILREVILEEFEKFMDQLNND